MNTTRLMLILVVIAAMLVIAVPVMAQGSGEDDPVILLPDTDVNAVHEALASLVYAALGAIAGLLGLLFRAGWKQIDAWWQRQVARLPENLHGYYQIAAEMAADYVEQLVASGQLEKTAKARIAEALDVGEKWLKQLGLKHADLDVLRMYIEGVVAQKHNHGNGIQESGEGPDHYNTTMLPEGGQ
jgi:hypothetical protein